MRILIVALVALAAVAPVLAQSPIGSWSWMSTELEGGVVETPESVGYTVQVQFSAEGEAFSFIDNALVEQAGWSRFYVSDGPVWYYIYMTGLHGNSRIHQFTVGELTLESMDGAPYRRETYSFVSAVPTAGFSFGALKALFR